MILWKNVYHNIEYLVLKPVPVSVRNWLAERLANLLPHRVVGWCLMRACRHYNYNQHIPLMTATKKFKKKPEGFRGVK